MTNGRYVTNSRHTRVLALGRRHGVACGRELLCVLMCVCVQLFFSVRNEKKCLLLYVLNALQLVVVFCTDCDKGLSSEPFIPPQQASVLHQPTSPPPYPASSRPLSTDSRASLISPTDTPPWRPCTPTACRPTPPRAPLLLTPSSKPLLVYSSTQVRHRIALFTVALF